MFVGPIENDQMMQVKIGEKLLIVADDKFIGKKGAISVKNCGEFPSSIKE